MPSDISLSLLIPAYNEEVTLEDVVRRSMEVLPQVSSDFEVIILDDASADRTWEIIQTLQARYPEIKAHQHRRNEGIAATFEELYRLATKDFVFLISGDGQYPPDILLTAATAATDYDVVVCRRISKPYGTYRRVISWAYNHVPKLLFGEELYDSGSVKLVRRRVLEEIVVTSRGVFVEAERLIKASRRGFRIGVVDMRELPRAAGEAGGAHPRLVLEAVRDLVSLWWRIRVGGE